MNFVFFHVVLIETGPRFFSVSSRNLVEIITRYRFAAISQRCVSRSCLNLRRHATFSD